MSVLCVPHLRAWLLEEAAELLEGTSEIALNWALDLLTAFWAESTLADLITDSLYLLPQLSFRRFMNFAARNYPAEFAAAICCILESCDAAGLAQPPLQRSLPALEP